MEKLPIFHVFYYCNSIPLHMSYMYTSFHFITQSVQNDRCWAPYMTEQNRSHNECTTEGEVKKEENLLQTRQGLHRAASKHRQVSGAETYTWVHNCCKYKRCSYKGRYQPQLARSDMQNTIEKPLIGIPILQKLSGGPKIDYKRSCLRRHQDIGEEETSSKNACIWANV